MRKYYVFTICLLLLLQLEACQEKTTKVEGFAAPESVTSDGEFFYVSNVGAELKPTVKDGDGFISKLSADGKILDLKFISGLNAPKGMVVLNSVLYVADIDKLKGFTLAEGKQVVDLDFSSEGTSFLNGMTVLEDGKLLVSAMDIGALYLVEPSETPSFCRIECATDLYGPNGLSYDPVSGTVYLCSFGKDHKPNGIVGKGRIEKNKFNFTEIYPQKGFYDGMVYHEGKVLFSDWVAFEKQGVLIMEDVETGESSIIDLGEKIGGPADFYLDQKEKKIWIPMMLENKILIAEY